MQHGQPRGLRRRRTLQGQDRWPDEVFLRQAARQQGTKAGRPLAVGSAGDVKRAVQRRQGMKPNPYLVSPKGRHVEEGSIEIEAHQCQAPFRAESIPTIGPATTRPFPETAISD